MTMKKKMTQREKDLRKKTKKDLQAKGILPPDKPRLNRKKFAKEVVQEWETTMNEYTDLLYLSKAMHCMVETDMKVVTPEAVGVLKAMKIAMETKKFMHRLEEEGQTQYTIGEYVDEVVLPIINL